MPLALLVLGVFNLSARAAELPELTPAFLVNNMFIFICAALVIFMNAGFAMVEAGMCRQKNAVNILLKNLIVFALAASAYWVIGYSLMYGDPVVPGWLFIKSTFFFFDPAVTPDMVKDGALVPSVDFLFQVAFAGTSATIVSGLVAERIKFKEFVWFSLILVAFIYPIAGAWKWNAEVGSTSSASSTSPAPPWCTPWVLGRVWWAPSFSAPASASSWAVSPRLCPVTTWPSQPWAV